MEVCLSRILLGWELGDGLGHVARLALVAEELRKAGHECFIALRNLEASQILKRTSDYVLLQAPYARPVAPRDGIHSFGDILKSVGYGDPARLGPLVQAWDGILDGLGIDLIIADYAPTLCLSARRWIPTIAIGDYFTLPSTASTTFPPFRLADTSESDEECMVETIRGLKTRRTCLTITTLPEIFSEVDRYIVTIPELADGLQPENGLQVVGPLAPLPAPARGAPSKPFFAYLSGNAPGIASALESIGRSGPGGQIFLRDGTPDQKDALRAAGVLVHEQPQLLVSKIEESRVFIHHGGLSSSEIALAVGRPQLLIPRHWEQEGNANKLRKLGVAVAMRSGGRFTSLDVAKALKHVSDCRKFDSAARHLAENIAKRSTANGLNRIMLAVNTRLGAAKPL